MKHLTKKDETRIVKLIQEWSGPKLTWPLLVDACNSTLGISRARQSLMKLSAIDLAMKDRKAALKAPTERAGWIKDINEANERVAKLSEANQQLKAINQELLKRFIIWQANAQIHGLSQAKLDQPLPQFK
uniref:hypothetical protein n=1 Tax=Rheinheimera sp. TaxID=1869214 RepID=UPI00404769B1